MNRRDFIAAASVAAVGATVQTVGDPAKLVKLPFPLPVGKTDPDKGVRMLADSGYGAGGIFRSVCAYRGRIYFVREGGAYPFDERFKEFRWAVAYEHGGKIYRSIHMLQRDYVGPIRPRPNIEISTRRAPDIIATPENRRATARWLMERAR